MRANLSAFRTFVRFVLVWFCRFPLPLGVWEGLWFVIVALPVLFSYLSLQDRYARKQAVTKSCEGLLDNKAGLSVCVDNPCITEMAINKV